MDNETLTNAMKKIKLLILDVDGVLADGIIIGNDGLELKKFNAHDGAGIKYWGRCGHKSAIITGRKSECVTYRAKTLGIDEVHQGSLVKLEAFKEVLEKLNIQPEETAYIGDDLMDLPVMIRVGLPVAVANARPEVKEHAAFVTSSEGGNGAVRDTIEAILQAQGLWQGIVNRYLEKE